MESTEDACEESQEDTQEKIPQTESQDKITRGINKELDLKKPAIQTISSLRDGLLANKFPFLYLKHANVSSLEYLQSKLINNIDEESAATEITPEDGETDSDNKTDNGNEISFWFNPGRAIFNEFVFSHLVKSKNYNAFPFDSFRIIGCKRNDQNKELNADDSNEKLSNPNSYSKFDEIYVQWGSEQQILKEYFRDLRSRSMKQEVISPNDVSEKDLENGVIVYHPIYINNPIPSNYFGMYRDEEKPIDYWLGCPNAESEKIFYDCYIIKIVLNKDIDCSNFKLLIKAVNIEGDYKIMSFI
jgi:hypothetical protein